MDLNNFSWCDLANIFELRNLFNNLGTSVRCLLIDIILVRDCAEAHAATLADRHVCF